MSRRFQPAARLVILCGLAVIGPATAEAAGVGIQLRAIRKTFRERLQGHTSRMSVWEPARGRHRVLLRTREAFSLMVRAKVRRPDRSNERSVRLVHVNLQRFKA
jgi:hypothetical protein